MADALSEVELEAIIGQQIELAKTHDRSERATARDKALDYYFGQMDKYVPPEANRSKVVSRDVADTIGWLMPEIMRVYTASGRMFVAEPVEPEDLSLADEVTDGLNHVFWKDNFGYGNVYDATWDALMHGDGIVKTYWDDAPVYTAAKFHDGLSEDELALLAGDDNVDVLAKTERSVTGVDPETMQPTEASAYDVKLRRKKADGKYCVVVIPPEEFLVSADATNIEDAAFKDHWQRKTRSELIEMGYDRDKVNAIPEASRLETPEQQARRMFGDTEQATDTSMQMVDYHECYIRVDADGDGVAELVRACYGGQGGNGKGSLLDWEVWEDEDPFDNIPCEPIPHRFGARSIADEEIDIQDVKTVLSRQMLNSTYWSVNPQRFAKGKIHNPEQLDNPVFGGTIFGDANSEVLPLPVPFVGDKALEGIRYMDEVSSRRTGVNSQSMALDPEVLQNQSATANNNAMAASRSQPELIARNMAEYGWSKVGRKLLRLMNKHDTKPRTILVKGKPVQIDPRNWNPDMHVNINTGLGTGSRDKDAMMLGTVLNQQILYTDRIGQVFPEKALDMLPYIHNTLTRFAESTGLRNPELYWPELDPNEIEQGKQILAQRQQQPNPKIEEIQAQGAIQMQIKQVDAQIADHAAQIKAQGDVVKNQAELEADLQTSAADREKEMMLEAQRQQLEREKIASTERVEMAKLAQQRELALAQLEAQDSETTDSKGQKKKTIRAKTDVHNEALMQGLAHLGSMVERMHASMTAPVEIVRDKTGRAVGTRKVMN